MTTRPRSSVIPAAVISKISRLQGALNSRIDPEWLFKKTGGSSDEASSSIKAKGNRSPEDWALAVTLEAAEAIDSYQWKWWKNVNQPPNIANVKIELVDILHFSLSGTMQIQLQPGGAAASASAASAANQEQQLKEWGLSSAIATPLTDTKNAIATFMNIIGLARFHKFDLITEHVIAAADDLGFNVVSYYLAKHTLNVIRQLGGYKDGTYVKVNKGKEDNELLHEVIAGITLEECVDEEKHEEVFDRIMDGVYEAFTVPQAQRKKTRDWI